MKITDRFLIMFCMIAALGCLTEDLVQAGGLNPIPEKPAVRDMSWWPFDATVPYSFAADLSSQTVIRMDAGSFDTAIRNNLDIPAALQASELAAHEPGMMLIQFTGPITSAQKSAVTRLGATLIEYYPSFTFSAITTPESALKINHLSYVRWVGRFHPAYRIHSSFGTRDLRHPERIDASTINSIITAVAPDYLPEIVHRITATGGQVTGQFSTMTPPCLTADIPPHAVFELARCEWIRSIEEQGEYFTLNDETQEVLQSGSVAGGTPVWDAGLHGEGQILGHMDSGIDPDHCFFYDDTQPLPTSTLNPAHRKIIAYRTYANGQAYDGCNNGHGTHTAGTAAGYTDDSAGTEYIGLAYEAKITVADVGQDDFISCLLGMLSVPSDISVIYQDAYNDGARVHTNSWGSTDNTYDAMATQTDTFMWDNKDFLILYAIGNSGPNAGTMGSPATSKNIIAVGGSNNEPDQNQVWDSSSRGPVNGSGRMAPALMAPSTDGSGFSAGIDSSASDGTTGTVTCGFIGEGYSGTSMACPAAAGAAILARQYFTDGYYPSGTPEPDNEITPTAALIRAVLINGASDMTGAAHRPNNDQGWGRVLLDDSLYFYGDSTRLRIEDNSPGVATGDTEEFIVSVSSNSAPLRLTLTWTDYPGDNLVNDLDLELEKDGTIWHGNNFTNGWSDSGTTVDRSLPTECIFLDTASVTPGDYTVRVIGYNVPQGEPGSGLQPWSMAITGDLTEANPCNNDGDVTLDDELTAGDAQLAFNIALGAYSPNQEEECAADCNGDSSVTAGDAQVIFQSVLGIANCLDPM